MPDRPIDTVVAALTVDGRPPRKSGSGYTARCPAHDDRNASLSVSEGPDGKVLLHCHAGCSQSDILAALATRGVSAADLFPETLKPPAKREITETYGYVDERGAVLFEVVRYHPKDFRQRRPDGAGGWIWNLGDVRRVLFRLPEVIAAVKAGTTIWIPEGERDVQSAEKVGAVATTSPGGAGKWRAEYADVLRGARVVVVADGDEAGLRHARDVEASLQGVAASVDVVEAAPGCKDLSDHLRAGHTLDDLQPLAGAPYPPADRVETRNGRSSESVSLSSIKRERIEFLVPGIPRGMLTLLVGDPGLGKSLRSVELAAQVSCSGRGVILLTNEDHYAAVVRPRLQAVDADLDRVYTIKMRGVEGDEDGLWLPDDCEHLARAIHERGADLFIIDPITAFLPDSVNSFKDQSVRTALRPLKEIAESTGASGLLLAHLNKAAGSGPLNRIGGSIAFPAAVRSAWLMARDPDDPDGEAGYRRVCAHIKCNVGAYEQSEVWVVRSTLLPACDGEPEVSTARIERHGVSPHSGSSLLKTTSDDERGPLDEAKRFLEEELADGSVSAKEMETRARRAGISAATLRRAKNALRATSSRDGFGQTGEWKWSLSPKVLNPQKATEQRELERLSGNPHGWAENNGSQHPEILKGDQSQRVSTFDDLDAPPDPDAAGSIVPVDRGSAKRLIDELGPRLEAAGYPRLSLRSCLITFLGRVRWSAVESVG